MKICFVIHGLKKGGAERVISLISNYFNSKGNEVSIVLTETSEVIAYEINKDINIIDISNKDKKNNLLKRRYNIIKNLRNVYKKYEPDIVISFITRTNIYAILAKIGLKIPIIISERNNPKIDPKSKITRALRNLIYPLSNGFVFQTEFARECFSKRISKKSVVIPNPITKEVYNIFDNIKNKEIITAGRLESQKNIKMLIEVYANICRDYPEYSLIIYGEGSLRNELEKISKNLNVSDKVSFMGQRDNLIELMNNSEIFVLPSDYEGMPNVLAEAMSVGLACISTDCPAYGSRFLIKDGENGILVPINNNNALENAIKKLIENVEFRTKISNNAKEVKNILSETAVMSMWENYIDNVLSK